MNVRKIALVLGFAACAPAADRTGKEGSTVTVLLTGDESEIWSDGLRFLLFLPLVARNSEGELEGRLARSWEHSPVDEEERDRIFRELMPLLQMDVPVTLLYPHMTAVVAHRRVHGLSSPFHADPVMHTEDLWVEEEVSR